MKRIGLLALVIIMFISCQSVETQDLKPQDLIRLNQIGFYPHALKIAVIEKGC